MARTGGRQATEQIDRKPHRRDVRVLILTTFNTDELVHAALRAGASGFLVEDTRQEQRLIEQFVGVDGPIDDHDELDQLTDRETEVLRAVAEGHSNAEIAEVLHLGYGTVKTHVSHLLTKLDARDRAQLVVFAYESGLVAAGHKDR